MILLLITNIGITALDTLQGTSSNDVQITGSITDSLSALYDASNAGAADNQGLRAAALNTAIAADNDVIVIVDEDNAITSDDFAKLNALAGHSGHDSTGNGGYIEATVSGTASAINLVIQHLII